MWLFLDAQKRHTQDGSELVSLMKGIGLGRKPVLAIDVGCGDGIIAHDLLVKKKATDVVAIDISQEAVAIAGHNLADFVTKGRAQIYRASAHAFFRQKKYWDTFDRFVINPPFFQAGSGRANKKHLDQIARHEASLGLKLWSVGAKRLLKTGGELYCVFPTERLAECLSALSANGVEPKELWWFKADLRKRRFFLRAVRNAKPGLRLHLDKL